MAEFYEVVAARRSVREYLSAPVDEAALARVLEAARLAPSWKNLQGWQLVVVRERETLRALGRLLGGNPRGVDYDTLPMMAALVMDPERSGEMNGMAYYLVDAGIYMEHLVLAAQAEGLGTCWIGWFDEPPIKRLLGVPEGLKLVALTPLGYPAGKTPARPRKEARAAVHWERW